jgi:hypothetical protein
MVGAVVYAVGMRRQINSRADARGRHPLPWREIVAIEAASSVRDLDEREARTHQALTEEERLERFHAALVARIDGGA